MYGYSHTHRLAKNRFSFSDRTKGYWLSSSGMNSGNLQEDTPWVYTVYHWWLSLLLQPSYRQSDWSMKLCYRSTSREYFSRIQAFFAELLTTAFWRKTKATFSLSVQVSNEEYSLNSKPVNSSNNYFRTALLLRYRHISGFPGNWSMRR